MTPTEFIYKWQSSKLKERSGSQEHFIDLCRLLDEPTPAEADPSGERYCFERGARKDTGSTGWADVWKRHHFAWEYKGRHANLDKAFAQLRQYALALENPPLLIVSDMERIRICTNWTNTVSKTYEYDLDDLARLAVREKLKWAMADPERLKPGETRQALTERAAATFAALAHALRDRGHDPQEVAHFINRLVFCMFAEDVDLLPNHMFTRMLQHASQRPPEFEQMARKLFGAMKTGGLVGFESVEWFNGGLFDDDSVVPLEESEIDEVLAVASLDWSAIEPSILGTLFERGLDPGKRSQLGAHYTDQAKIQLIVEPVVIRPWLAEWETQKVELAACLQRAESAKAASTSKKQTGRARQLLHAFLERLRAFTVLDPACGSGNFLFVALHALKDLEHRIQLEAEELGFDREFPKVGPANVKGIEVNAYAAELARVSVWIGEIQWMRRNGFQEARNPILEPLETIECRDAILTRDGTEPDWPEADAVIGNPPFLGGKLLRSGLGGEYFGHLRRVYGSRIHGEADLVCHWFDKAGRLVADGKLARCGLVATNSIRGGRNRPVLDRIVEQGVIFDAWPDEPWVVEGAAVRVSLVCFAGQGAKQPIQLRDKPVTGINADLTSGSLQIAKAVRLARNAGVAFMGNTKNGPFEIPGDLAREWLRLPANPNGRPNSDVLRPWINGMDLTRRPADKWIVDFGWTMDQSEAALYEAPFSYVAEKVKPIRQRNRAERVREFWWRHEAPRPGMWRALDGLTRYIATPTVAKHRLFAWCDARICPDHALIAIARADEVTFGILHSRFHELWSLRLGTWLGKGNDPRYTPTTTFETFPFPEGLGLDMPASAYADDPRAKAIADAASHLVGLRDRWLNPPEWVEWTDEPVGSYPKHPVPRNEQAATALKARTLTNLYNVRPQWLVDAHTALDEAVAAAYGWPTDISDAHALGELLELNAIKQA